MYARVSRPRMRRTLRLRDEDILESSVARKILSANFKMLKEEIDHFQVAKHLKEKGIVDEEFYQTFRELRTRREKVEALLIKVDLLLSESNDSNPFKAFKEALNENHDSIINALQKQPNCPEVRCTSLEQVQLCGFFEKAKDKIIATMEPRQFIDDLVSVHAIDLQQYELITKKESRKERATELYNIAAQNFKLIKQLFEFYKELSSEYKKECSTYTLASNPEATPVALRYSLTEKNPTQDTTEHSDVKSEIKKVEKDIVESANDDPELRTDILHKAASLLERVKLGSIIFNLRTSGDMSIESLKECCKNGTAVDWLMSILKPDDIKKLQKLNVNGGVIECYIDTNDDKKQIFDEVFQECCCVLNRDFIQSHLKEFEAFLHGSEVGVIKAMLTNGTLDETLAFALSQIKDSASNKDLMQKLIEFLLHSELQQICFCLIEEELRKKKEYNLFQQQQQPSKKSLGEKVDDEVTIVKENIKKSVDLLEEELDGRWFIEILESREEEACMKILTAIKRSQSRKSCTKQFVRFLCEEEDVDWFIEALYEYSPHVLAILTQSKNQTIECDTRLALLSVYEFIIDELEPLELKSCLSNKILEQLNFLEMEKIGNRFDRTTFFMRQVLKAENLEIIQDVMVAIASKYPNIERVIKDVLTKGSLSEHYFCPRIVKHKMLKTIYKANFKLPIPNAAVSLEVLPDKQNINHASSEGLSPGDNTIYLSSSEMEHQNKDQSKSVFTDTNITLFDKEEMIVETKIDRDQYKETICIEGNINLNTDMQKTMPVDENRTSATEVDSSTDLHSGLEIVDVKYTDKSPDDISSPIQHDIQRIYSVDNIETDKLSSSEMKQLSNGNKDQSKSIFTDTNISLSDKEGMIVETKIDGDQYKETICIEGNINLNTDMQKTMPVDENRTSTTEVDSSTDLHSGLEIVDVKYTDKSPDDISSPIQHDIQRMKQLSNGNDDQSKSVFTDGNLPLSDKEKKIENNLTENENNLTEKQERGSTEVDQSTYLHSAVEMSVVKHNNDKPFQDTIAIGIPYNQFKINAADGPSNQIKYCDQGPKKLPEILKLKEGNSKAICKNELKPLPRRRVFLKLREKRLDTQVSANYDAKVQNKVEFPQERFEYPLEYRDERYRYEFSPEDLGYQTEGYETHRWFRENNFREQDNVRRHQTQDKQRWNEESNNKKQYDLLRNPYECMNQYYINRRYPVYNPQYVFNREGSMKSWFPHERGYSYPPQRWNQELYNNHPPNFDSYGGYMHQKYY
ncbi:uncharacterized protein LOC132758513 [Ruditapes philippinarum]|uniref:uncharacterized protein LOC132758513 n=1 Tax=Ruditapes philippinarum TaxID=129788 RepID=UPI00295B4D72|nr:uncharacterized protein LOC132758513 [Ruditapes philippinarum]